MKKIMIHQLLNGFAAGDAISNYALELRKIFRSWGYGSHIFVPPAHLDPRMANAGQPLIEHARHSSPDNILIYHFSIGSTATDYFKNIPDKKIVIYHNITPARYFALIKPETAAALEGGRRELFELRPVTDLALGVSEYNRRELEEAGFTPTGTIPLAINWSSLKRKPSWSVRLRYLRNRNNILFVGRIVPNKKIEDLLKVFFYYKKTKPTAQLFLVGSHAGNESYFSHLLSVVKELSLTDVFFSDHVSHSQLLAYYKLARIFLCLSEHEGFCMPLLESMHFGIPVMAYAAGAVPETLNGAGILIREKNYPEIAEMAALLCNDKKFRQAIIEGQYRRLEEFKSVSLEDKLKEHLGPWLKPQRA